MSITLDDRTCVHGRDLQDACEDCQLEATMTPREIALREAGEAMRMAMEDECGYCNEWETCGHGSCEALRNWRKVAGR